MIYWFKPNRHWNVINREVYLVLRRFFSDEYFKLTDEKLK